MQTGDTGCHCCVLIGVGRGLPWRVCVCGRNVLDERAIGGGGRGAFL